MRMAARRRRPRAGDEGGFTLLELLVAMTLLSLIAVMMVQGLRLGAKARERLDAATETAQAATQGLDLVRRQLSRMQLVVWRESEVAHLAFAGAPERVRFVTAEPSYLPGAAIMLWELSLDGIGERRRLMLRRAAPDPALPGFAPLDRALPQELMSVQAALAFSYLGVTREGVPPVWQQTWRDTTRLPLAIRLGAGGIDQGWPGLIVRPLIDVAAHCPAGGGDSDVGCEP